MSVRAKRYRRAAESCYGADRVRVQRWSRRRQGQLFFIAGRAFVFATSLFCKPAFRCSQFQKGTQVEVVHGANLGLYPSLIQDN